MRRQLTAGDTRSSTSAVVKLVKLRQSSAPPPLSPPVPSGRETRLSSPCSLRATRPGRKRRSRSGAQQHLARAFPPRTAPTLHPRMLHHTPRFCGPTCINPPSEISASAVSLAATCVAELLFPLLA
eukprot:1178395-Prorocentrum_minimum.AAC.12